MRRVLIALAVLAALLVVAIIAIPMLFKDRLVALVNDTLSEQLGADVTMDDVSLSMLSSFPSLEMTISGLKITNREPFAGVEMARIGVAEVAVNVPSLLGGGAVEIRSLRLGQSSLHIVVDEQGRANYDVGGSQEAGAEAQPAEPAPEKESAFSLALRDYGVEDLDLIYDDRAGGTRVEIDDLDHKGSAELGDVVKLATRTDIRALTLRDGGVDLMREVKLGADFAMDYDTASGVVTFGENRVQLNQLPLAFEGSYAPQAGGAMLDLRFSALETSFASILSLIPAVYRADIAGIQTSGQLALQGAIKGLLPDQGDELPAIDLALQVKDGRFKYPDLPSAVEQIAFDLKIKHPGGLPDNAEIDLETFHFAVAGMPMEGSLHLRHPESDPDVDLKLKGDLDLAKLAEAVPTEGVTYTGQLAMNVDVAGRVSAFEAQQLDAIRANGTFRLENFLYTDASLPEPVTIERLDLAIEPSKLDMADLRVRFGASDLRATGRVDNALAYILTDAPLKGEMKLSSTMLDLRPWSGDSEGDGADAPAEDGGLATVPDNLDLTLDADLKHVLYDRYDLTDVTGQLVVRDGAVRMDPLSFTMLGGQITLKGGYNAPTAAKADVDMDVDMKDFKVAETLAFFDTLARVAPVAQKSGGRFSSGFTMKTTLGKDYSPDLETLFSSGSLQLQGVELSPAFLEKVSSYLKNERFKSLDLDGSVLGFLVEGGRLKLDELPLQIGGVKGTLAGTTGVLDQKMNLKLAMTLPTSAFGAPEALGKLGVTGSGDVDLLVKVLGTFDDPKVSFELGKLTSALVDDAREQVVEAVTEALSAEAQKLLDEARKKGDALVAAAELKADQLRDEAKKAGDKLIAEADKSADKLMGEAGNNPVKQAAAKETGKKLRGEAKEKAGKLEKEADKAARKVVNEAGSQRDRLIADAQAKIDAGGR